jgi:hypothetical protein
MALTGDKMRSLPLLIAILMVTVSFAGIVSYTHIEHFSPSVSISHGEASVNIVGDDFRIHNEPDLPGRAIRIALPPGTTAESITIISDFELLASAVSLRNANITEFDNPWAKSAPPANVEMPPAQLDGTSYLYGVPLAEIFLRPVTYNPTTGELRWNRSIEIKINTMPNSDTAFKFERLTPVSSEIRDRILLSSVVNSEDLPPRPRPLDLSELHYPTRSFPPSPGDDKCDGVIIADDRYIEHLQPLKDEINFGLILEIVPISRIISSYPGSSDRAEKLRRYIKDAYANWGISGVFLVGDAEHIPVRFRYGLTPNSPIFIDIPSDMYYTAMDGEWNSNRDAYFGNSEEDDFVPELIIGRFPAENSEEIEAYLAKLRYHRWELDFDWTTRWMFMGASIQGTDFSGPKECDSIITAGPIPDDVDIYKLYAFSDTTGGDDELTEVNTLRAFEDGKYIVFHLDHGFRYILHTGKHTYRGSGIDIPQFMSLTNGPYYPFFYSYSCEVNSFDVGCVGSASVRSRAGGFVAMLAHSRSAYSNHKQLVHSFWGRSFLPAGRTVRIGEAVRSAQIDFGESNTGRYYKTILNLIGYPFLDMYLGRPTEIELDVRSHTISSSDTLVEVAVLDAVTSLPIDDVLVVAHTPDGGYCMVRTSTDGRALLKIRPGISEYLVVTASGNGAFPVSDTIEIIPAETEYVVLLSSIFYPGGGDHDILPEPGDTFACALILRNIGVAPAESVVIDVSVPGIIETTSVCPIIASSENCTLDVAFGFVVDPALRGTVNLRPIITISSENHTEIETLALGLYGPIFQHTTTFYIDGADGIPQAGENGILAVGFANIGPGDFRGGIVHVELAGAVAESTLFEIGNLSSNSHDTVFIPIEITSHYLLADLLFTFINTTSESINFVYSKPLPPDSLRMNPSEDMITVYWKPPIDSTIIGYYVYRGDSIAENFAKVRTLPISSAIIVDEGLPERTRFHYYVTSGDMWYNESHSSDTILAWTTLPMMEPWPIQIGLSREIYSSLAVFDADDDGDMEIYAVGKKYSAVWGFYYDGIPIIEGDDITDPFRIISGTDTSVSEMGMWSSPAIGSPIPGRSYLLTNDRTYPGKVYLIDAITGENAPGWPQNTAVSSMGTPVMADLDGDGIMEILNPHHEGLDVWRIDGTSYIPGANGVFASLETGMTGPLWGSPAVGDINGDGYVEIVMGFGKDENAMGTIYVFDYRGEILPGWPVRVRNADFSNVNPTLANFDDDTTTLEILVSAYRGGTFIFDYQGDSLPGWPINEYALLFYESHTAVADFDNDGICEAVIAGVNKVGVHHADGTYLPGWPKTVPESGQTIGNPTIGDLTGNGQWDIVFSMGKRIYAYDIAGKSLPGFPLVMPDLCAGAPTLCDLDGDGRLDIATGALDSYIYIWNTGIPYGETSVAWPTEKGNFHRTGLYGDHWRIMPVEEASLKVPNSLSISTHPNPFNSSVHISIEGVGERLNPARIEIYDIAGRTIDIISESDWESSNSPEIQNSHFHGNDKVVIWTPATSVGSGVYFLRVVSADVSISKRIVYLK